MPDVDMDVDAVVGMSMASVARFRSHAEGFTRRYGDRNAGDTTSPTSAATDHDADQNVDHDDSTVVVEPDNSPLPADEAADEHADGGAGAAGVTDGDAALIDRIAAVRRSTEEICARISALIEASSSLGGPHRPASATGSRDDSGDGDGGGREEPGPGDDNAWPEFGGTGGVVCPLSSSLSLLVLLLLQLQ